VHQKFREIEIARNELHKRKEDERKKIEFLRDSAIQQILSTMEKLEKTVNQEFNKLDEDYVWKTAQLNNANLEIQKIMNRTSEIEEKITVEKEAVSKVSVAVESQQTGLPPCIPTIHPCKTFSRKAKYADVGFVQLAEFMPEDFKLVLKTCNSVEQMFASGHCEQVCQITTSQSFTEKIQANIKIAVVKKGSKAKVRFVKDGCGLATSTDRQTFKITFLAPEPGDYTITVKLYNENIGGSPLCISRPAATVVTGQASRTQTREESLHFSASFTRSSSSPLPESVPLSTNASSLVPASTVARAGSVASDVEMECKEEGGAQMGSKKSTYAALKMFSIKTDSQTGMLVGSCLLARERIVLANLQNDIVMVFNSTTGVYLSEVRGPAGWNRPGDLCSLAGGGFVVRDKNASRLFSAECEYVREVMRFRGGERGWGVSQDSDGNLVTIVEITRPKSFKLIFTDVETCQPKKEVALHDIIPRENIAASLCKFLTCHQGRIYITDLGLNLVYVFNLEESDVMIFGGNEKSGQFSDPAGLVVDGDGWMIVADSKNHRLCLFNDKGEFEGRVRVGPEMRRPSGLQLDKDKKELYVLTLSANVSLTKYKLQW